MHPVTLFCASILLLATSMANSVNPGLKMRVTNKGIVYANTIAQTALQNGLKTLKIPDQSGKDHHFTWSLTNIRTESVSGPSSSISLNPGQDGLTWALSNFAIHLKSDWRVKYKKAWIKVSDSGTVDVGVSGVSLTVTLGFGSKGGRPSISVKSCDAHIGDVSVSFHGGTAFIWNLFRGIVKDKIKKTLQSKICEVVTKEVNVDADAALGKLKVNVEIDHRFLLDYSVIAPAVITAGYIESLHKGEIYWLSDKTECPFFPGPIPAWTDTSSMLYIWMTEYSAATFAYVAHNHGFLKYNLTRNDLPKDHLDYLNTTCQSVCIGKLIPQIGKKYPNSWVEMRISSTAVPHLKFTSQDLTVSAWADVEMYAHTPDGQTVYMFTLNVSLSLTGKAAIEKEKLLMTIVNHSFDLGVVKSDIGELDSHILKILLGGALDLVVIPELNRIGSAGIDLPLAGAVKLLNTKLILQEGALLVATDVMYQKNWDTLWFSPEVHINH